MGQGRYRSQPALIPSDEKVESEPAKRSWRAGNTRETAFLAAWLGLIVSSGAHTMR